MQLTRQNLHEQVYRYGLVFLALSMPLSVFTLSLTQIILLLNWMVEGRMQEKWQRFKANRALWVFLSLYLLHLVSLAWSSDLAYGLKDLKIKLSLFILPLIMGTSQPIDRKLLDQISLFFTLGVLVASLASVAALLGCVPTAGDGYRGLSLFMSHIRFSLMIVLALLMVVWVLFLRSSHLARPWKIYYLVLLIWFSLFLIILKALSGIFILAFLTFFLLIRAVFEIRDVAIRFMVFVPVILIPLFSIIYLGHAINTYYSFEVVHLDDIDSHTIQGNPYKNYPNFREVENGHYVWLYICDVEMEAAWEERSELDFWGRTHNDQSLRTTLIRYLTSRGLRKDAHGMKQLEDYEIAAIEEGVANYIYLDRFSLYPRIYELIWEIDRYRLGYSPNEKSVVQRYLYLEAGWKISRSHPWIGVGVGGVKQAFQEYYEAADSPLEKKWRRRAHNQFLTFAISFGIPGMLWCIFALLGPLFLAGRHRSFLATGFFILISLSMVNEDTLETAVGAAFVAFFYALFIFGPNTPWLSRKLFRRGG